MNSAMKQLPAAWRQGASALADRCMLTTVLAIDIAILPRTEPGLYHRLTQPTYERLSNPVPAQDRRSRKRQ